MHQKNLLELMECLNSGEISSVELTQHYLKRIETFDSTLNSYVTVTPEKALAAAEKADAARAAGKAKALTGLPIAHKDNFCTKGVKTTCGSRMLDNFTAPYSATLVEKLEEAGCIMLGKANMDEFAMGSSNETSFYGAVKNPWDTTRVPGGSSGGSAALVAMGLAPAATGTDTGGSVRQPAAFCGITGIKPTYGRISRFGMVAFASSLDQAGPMTRTAAGAALLLENMAGFDPKDATSVDQPVPEYTKSLNDDLTGLKIGLPKEYFDTQLDSGMADSLESARKVLEDLGAECQEISLPNCRLSVPVYYVLALAECASNLARYDGVRYGYRCESPKDLEDLYFRSRGEGFGSEVKRRIMLGTYVLSSGYYDSYYKQAQRVRRLVQNDFQTAFESVDVIFAPTTPLPAFTLDGQIHDPIQMYLADIYTNAVNLAGLPALSMPAGHINGLPIGAQLIGKHFDEARILNVAHRFQQNTDHHQKMPNEKNASFDR